MRRVVWVLAIILVAAMCAVPFHPGGVALAENVEVGDTVPAYAPVTTDTGNGVTVLSDVPADATGYLRTIQMYVGTGGASGIKVGTFYETGTNTYKCRAVVGISDQTANKHTLRLDSMGSAISLECQAGDLIGFYCSGGGGLRHYDTGDTGRYSVSGDYVTFGAEATFTPIASEGLLLHGSSTTSYFTFYGLPWPRWYETQVEVLGFFSGTHADAWGVVVGDSSHDEPGDVAPTVQTDYTVDRYQVTETHNSDIDSYYAPAGLTSGQTYYCRAAIYFDAPYNMWVYSVEESFDVPTQPDEECHHQVGFWPDPVPYTCVRTDNVTTNVFGSITFNGSVDTADTGVGRAGWVYDTSSHANPDGWPTDYSDVAPEATDYAGVLDATYSDYYQTEWQETVSGWLEGVTVYYRFFVDFVTPGDYIYGPELSFETPGAECTEWEHQTLYTPDEYPIDGICPHVWSMEAVAPVETHDINTLRLCLYREGTPTFTDVYLYECDGFTWEPTGLPLASAAIDVSAITTLETGQWVDVSLNTSVTLEVDHVYAILLKGRDVCAEGGHAAVWVTTSYETSEYLGSYARSDYDGPPWTWKDRDALFECWDCLVPETTYVALYETWGYTPSTHPAWYQAWPSFLKLAYIGIVLTSAVLAYRYEPKRDYPPDLPDMPELPPQ